VLVIDAYGGKWGMTNQVITGIQQSLRSGPSGPLEFVQVSLEAQRRGAEALQSPLIDYLGALFSDEPPGLVVAIGWPAAEFLTSHREQLFPSTPALLTALGTRQLEGLKLRDSDAYVTYPYDPAWSMREAQALFPGVKRVFVVEGSSPEERRTHAAMAPYLATSFPGLEQAWSTGMSFDQMLDAVARLPVDGLVIYVAFEQDSDGKRLQDTLALPEVVRRASVPVVGAFQHHLGEGVAATVHLDIPSHTQEAARAAAALLSGERPAAHRRASPGVMDAAFDASALEARGLDVPDRPGARVINARVSFWQAYRGYLLVGLSVAVLQAFLIVVLVAGRRRLRQEQVVSADLRRKLVTAQDDEQRRVSRELHDDFAQRLGRLSLDAARLAQPGSDVASLSAEMRETLASLAADVSAMSYRLHPATLEDLGLEEAIRQECASFGRRERLEIHFTGSVDRTRVSRDVALALYRVLQESLRNVSRHAKASHVQVTLMAVGERVQLAVRDDGEGFVLGHADSPGPHLGLASMRERMTLVGGEVAVESEPGAGTSVVAWAGLAQSGPPLRATARA
jgi:signal transduction histidine kinase